MVARLCRFKSCCPHQKKTIRKGCLFSCGSGLETKLRFVGKRHCVCVPLHAVQLAQRFASKLARLCYYVRFAHYKSCCPHQKRQSERVVFFHATADLKQNYVLSANGTAFVCPCTQLTRRSAIILPRLCYYARFAYYKSCCPHQKSTECCLNTFGGREFRRIYVLRITSACRWQYPYPDKKQCLTLKKRPIKRRSFVFSVWGNVINFRR